MIGLIRLLFQSDGPSRLPNRTLQRQGKFARAIVRHAQARPPCLDLSAALLGSALPNLLYLIKAASLRSAARSACPRFAAGRVAAADIEEVGVQDQLGP
jgi:hypothetical protein